MTSRLLAFALAILIGSPTCWCCVSHPGMEVKAQPKHACCRSSDDSETSGQPAKKKDPCPCSLSQTKRDLAKARILVPAAQDLDLQPIARPSSDITPGAFTTLRSAITLADALPPWRTAALYQRHCALLL